MKFQVHGAGHHLVAIGASGARYDVISRNGKGWSVSCNADHKGVFPRRADALKYAVDMEKANQVFGI